MIEYRWLDPEDVEHVTDFYARYFYAKDGFVSEENAHNCAIAVNRILTSEEIIGAAIWVPQSETVFLGKEIKWAAVDPAYRRNGIAEHLIRMILNNTQGDIYASAWRTNNETAHIHTTLKNLGFGLVQRPRVSWQSGITCRKENCPYGLKDRFTCYCYEDTYVLKR